MKVFLWESPGFPPAPASRVAPADCWVLQRVDAHTARLMLVRDFAIDPGSHYPRRVGYIASPVLKSLSGHVGELVAVDNSDILGRWSIPVPLQVVEECAAECRMWLVWPDNKGDAP